MNSKTLFRLILALLPVLGPAPLTRSDLTALHDPERPAPAYTRHLPLVTHWYSPKALPANPLDVSVSLTPDRAIRATIPITGGTLTTTAADGTRFTLTIPNNALLSNERITMTPLSGISGLPAGGGPVVGVQLAPEGLHLLQPASLTITPTTPIPLERQLAFTYRSSGSQFHLYPLDLDSAALRFSLAHFSGYGIVNASPAQRTLVVEYNAYGDEAALQQRLADLAYQRRNNQIDADQYYNQLVEIFRAYFYASVLPMLRAATTDEDLLGMAENNFTMWRLGLQVKGLYDEFTALIEQGWTLYWLGVKNAYDRAYERCVTQNDPSQVLNMMGWLRKRYLYAGEEDTLLDREKIDRCARFELTFDSTVTLYRADGSIATAHVRSVVPVQLEEVSWNSFLGAGPLVYLSLTLQHTVCPEQVDRLEQATTQVLKAGIDLNVRESAAPAISLLLTPGYPHETITVTCGGVPLTGPNTLWAYTFYLLHQDESLSPGLYLIEGWAAREGSTYATKVYNREGTSQNDTGHFEDHTTLELKHTPQR